jgi:TetR/AcrR family transcriptional repressor of nem operon
MPGMVRTKQFDKHAALDDAMQLFWERGYHATSIQDLVDRLGVNRQSLYDTFGGKDRLFLAALERYREIQATPVRRLLEREGPALEVLREFLHSFVDNLLNGDFKGCFIANTITELAGHDPAVTQACAANTRQIEGALSGLLLRAQQAGDRGGRLTVAARAVCDEHDARACGDGQGDPRQESAARHRRGCSRGRASLIFFAFVRLIVPI